MTALPLCAAPGRAVQILDYLVQWPNKKQSWAEKNQLNLLEIKAKEGGLAK